VQDKATRLGPIVIPAHRSLSTHPPHLALGMGLPLSMHGSAGGYLPPASRVQSLSGSMGKSRDGVFASIAQGRLLTRSPQLPSICPRHNRTLRARRRRGRYYLSKLLPLVGASLLDKLRTADVQKLVRISTWQSSLTMEDGRRSILPEGLEGRHIRGQGKGEHASPAFQ
jgi:hypothetical protein